MQLDQSNIREMVRKADRSLSWHIECNTNLHSLCALSIFTEILKKETIKYEVGYESQENDVNFVLSIDKKEYLLSNAPGGLCSCENGEMSGIGVIYGLAKSLGFVTESTLWPVAVAYSYYRDFVLTNIDSEPARNDAGGNSEPARNVGENAHNVAIWRKFNDDGMIPNERNHSRICLWCMGLHTDILAQLKIINCQTDGMFSKDITALPFLNSSCLFTTLKNDINFIFMRKLFNNRSKQGDRKICEILAGAGISIAFANENYTSVSQSVQEIVDRTFGTRKVFVYKSGHDLEIQAIEHAMLVLFYLYRGHGLYGLLSMRKRKLVDTGKASRFYQNVVRLFKDGVTYHRNLNNVVVFQLKGVSFTAEEAKVLFEILDGLFQRYILYQYCEIIPRLIVGTFKAVEGESPNSMAILYSRSFRNTKAQIKGLSRISENLLTINSRDLSSVISHMF